MAKTKNLKNPTSTDTKAVLTVPESAEYLGMSRASFYRIAKEHIPEVRYGEKMVRYRLVDLDAFIESNINE